MKCLPKSSKNSRGWMIQCVTAVMLQNERIFRKHLEWLDFCLTIETMSNKIKAIHAYYDLVQKYGLQQVNHYRMKKGKWEDEMSSYLKDFVSFYLKYK